MGCYARAVHAARLDHVAPSCRFDTFLVVAVAMNADVADVTGVLKGLLDPLQQGGRSPTRNARGGTPAAGSPDNTCSRASQPSRRTPVSAVHRKGCRAPI